MRTLKVTIVGGLFAAAAVLGAIAVTRTVSLGAAQTRASDAKVQVRAKQLDRFEASLRRSLAKKPPALPAIPKLPVVTQHPASVTQYSATAPQQPAPLSVTPAPTATPQPRVIYRRPPPIVVVRHVPHGDDGTPEAAGTEDGAAADGEGSGD